MAESEKELLDLIDYFLDRATKIIMESSYTKEDVIKAINEQMENEL